MVFSYDLLSQTNKTPSFLWKKTHNHVIMIALYIDILYIYYIYRDNYRYIPWTALIIYLYSVKPKYQKSMKPWSLRWLKPTSLWLVKFSRGTKTLPAPWRLMAGSRLMSESIWIVDLYGFIWIYMDLYGFIRINMDLYGFIWIYINIKYWDLYIP